MTWCFSVTNTGDTTLAPVTLDDADLGITEADLTVLSGDLTSLAPGDTAVLYLDGFVDGDLTNTVDVAGTPADAGGTPLPGVDAVTDDDTAAVDEVAPGITLDKTAYRGHDGGAGCPGAEVAFGRQGADVTWCFSVTNTGDTTLAPVTLDDADLGVTEADLTVLSGDLARLDPGDGMVLYLEGTIDGDLVNTGHGHRHAGGRRRRPLPRPARRQRRGHCGGATGRPGRRGRQDRLRRPRRRRRL